MDFGINSGSSKVFKQKCSVPTMAKAVGAGSVVLEKTSKGFLRVSVDDGLYSFPCGKSVKEDTKLNDITLGLSENEDGETWVGFVQPVSTFAVLDKL